MSAGVIAAHYVAAAGGGGGGSGPGITGTRVRYSAEAETGYADGATMTQWTDRSGNGHHALPIGTPKWRATGGPVNNGPWIDTTSGFFAIPVAAFTGLTAATAEIWVNPLDTGEGGHWNLGADSALAHYPYSNTIYDEFGSTARKTVGTLASRAWQRYRASSGPGVWTAWVNGTQIFTTASNTVGWDGSGGSYCLGANNNTGGYRVTGLTTFILIDHVLPAGEESTLEAWAVANPSGG